MMDLGPVLNADNLPTQLPIIVARVRDSLLCDFLGEDSKIQAVIHFETQGYMDTNELHFYTGIRTLEGVPSKNKPLFRTLPEVDAFASVHRMHSIRLVYPLPWASPDSIGPNRIQRRFVSFVLNSLIQQPDNSPWYRSYQLSVLELPRKPYSVEVLHG